MKFPETLAELIDLLQAKGCIEFDYKDELRLRFPQAVPSAFVPSNPFITTTASAAMPTKPPGPSDIDLALNPPVLDLDDEEPGEFVLQTPHEVATRVSVPAGTDPDFSVT